MGRVTAAMRDAGIDQSEIDDYLKRAMAGDYDHLLGVSMETVDVSFSQRPIEARGRRKSTPARRLHRLDT